MLSSGQFHVKIPKDLEENLEYRSWCLKKAHSDKWQRIFRQACGNDILFYINSFVWQYNPNLQGGEVGPFVTWDFQDEAFQKILWCIENSKDLFIEKSRELGASWVCLMAMDWICQWHRRKKFLAISRNADAVDRPEDPDCLFWKVDFVHSMLPEWMIEGKVSRRKMGFKYLDTHSIFNGQATTGKAGVGGRATGAFIDEMSQIAEGREVLHRTADTTRCRIFNGTHTDTGTAFYELSQRTDIIKLIMHWSQHPYKNQGLYKVDPLTHQVEILDKNFIFPVNYRFVRDGSPSGGPYPHTRSPWYDEECRRRQSARAVSTDLDINPTGASSQFFDPIVIQDLRIQYAMQPYKRYELNFDPVNADPVGLEEIKLERGLGKVELWENLTHDSKVPAGYYAFGADISTGTGASPSCLSGMNVRTGEKVFQYIDRHIEPKRFAAFAVAICKMFCDPEGFGAMLAWEANGVGGDFGKKVIELGYHRIYFREQESAIGAKDTNLPGWASSKETKLMLLSDFKDALNSRRYCQRSDEAFTECLHFIYKDGTVEHAQIRAGDDPSGQGTNHGDITVADALSYRVGKNKLSQIKKKDDEVKPGSLAWRRQLRQNRRRSEAWVN